MNADWENFARGCLYGVTFSRICLLYIGKYAEISANVIGSGLKGDNSKFENAKGKGRKISTYVYSKSTIEVTVKEGVYP